MNNPLYLILLSTVILITPLYGGVVRRAVKHFHLNPGVIIWMLVLAFSVTIVGYSLLAWYSLSLVLAGLGTNLTDFLNLPLTGKGLIFYSLLVYSIIGGWHCIIYPLVRDFEQIRQEAQQKSDSKQRKDMLKKKDSI